jgi:hypothetical protein
MVSLPDIDLSGRHTWALYLRVTSKAEVHIPLDQKLGVDAPVWAVTDGAALPQRPMLKDNGPGLLPMALCTGFIQTRHRQPAGWFTNVAAMRVVAVHAVHFPLQHWVVLRKLKFSLFLAMALETSRRVFARIDDELAPAAATRDVQAPGSVA